MPDPSTPRLHALHELRVKGYVDRDDDRFRDLEKEGLAERRRPGWTLTADGRSAHVDAVAGEVDGRRPAVESAYRRFCEINPELLQVCTDWQLRTGGVNDHSDAAYDKAVLERLDAVHERIRPVLLELSSALSRFGSYAPRLANALDRIHEGEYEWFTRPVLDSYHTVWFELHEDLLATLGLSRGDEARGAT